MEQQQGLIAILDALGAASYSRDQIDQFLNSRQLVIDELMGKAAILGIEAESVTTFTFNDTILIAYSTSTPATLTEVKLFGELLRRFDVRSLANGILFRGAIAIGSFHRLDTATNTVMGDAVTDAAAWYDRTDWIGITATPQATLLIQALLESSGANLERLFVNYSVPLKNQQPVCLKAVNWPKAFFVQGMTPAGPGEKKRAKCLSLLVAHGVPKGTESKYFNTMAFFDHCAKLYEKERKAKKKR